MRMLLARSTIRPNYYVSIANTTYGGLCWLNTESNKRQQFVAVYYNQVETCRGLCHDFLTKRQPVTDPACYGNCLKVMSVTCSIHRNLSSLASFCTSTDLCRMHCTHGRKCKIPYCTWLLCTNTITCMMCMFSTSRANGDGHLWWHEPHLSR